VTIIRWIFFLPAGILVGGLIQGAYPFLIAICLAGTGYDMTPLVNMFAAIFSGAGTIYVSARVAPTQKKLFVAVSIVVLFLSLFILGIAVITEPGFYNTLIFALQIVGAIGISVLIYRGDIDF